MKSAQMTDSLHGLLRNMAKGGEPSSELLALDELIGDDMTSVEIECTTVNLNMLRAASFHSGDTTITGPEEAEDLLSKVESFLSSKADLLASPSAFLSDTAIPLRSETPSAPTWRFFHQVFSLMDTSQAARQLGSTAARRKESNSSSSASLLSKERATRLISESGRITEGVGKCTESLRSNLSEPGMLGSLIQIVFSGGYRDGDNGQEPDNVLRTELEDSMDASALEMFCGSLMESWAENLSGCLKLMS